MNAVRKGIAALLILLLFAPAVQQFTGFPKVKGLKGYFELPTKPVFSFQGFYQGTYQDSLNKWIEHHIGFRPVLVRINNQFRYCLFDTIAAQAVIRGKDDFLYEMNYIKALYGLDYVGNELVEQQSEKLAFISRWLSKHNKHLLVLLAPGKASFYPEYVPERYKPASVGQRNDFAYANVLTQKSVTVIHCNPWFSAMRDTSQFALFPKSGIHWSYYGLGLAFDSLLSTMESVSGRRWLQFATEGIELSRDLRSPDRDLWEALNILSRPDDFAMPYPRFRFSKSAPAPKVMVVADSYYWQWFGSGYATEAFGEHSFWYYNEQIYPGDGSNPIDRRNVDLLLRVLGNDFVIILLTDANMYRFGFGFVEQLYDALMQYDALSEEDFAAWQKIIDDIRSSRDWMELVKKKAAERNISEEEMLRLDAFWVLENNKHRKMHD